MAKMKSYDDDHEKLRKQTGVSSTLHMDNNDDCAKVGKTKTRKFQTLLLDYFSKIDGMGWLRSVGSIKL